MSIVVGDLWLWVWCVLVVCGWMIVCEVFDWFVKVVKVDVVVVGLVGWWLVLCVLCVVLVWVKWLKIVFVVVLVEGVEIVVIGSKWDVWLCDFVG